MHTHTQRYTHTHTRTHPCDHSFPSSGFSQHVTEKLCCLQISAGPFPWTTLHIQGIQTHTCRHTHTHVCMHTHTHDPHWTYQREILVYAHLDGTSSLNLSPYNYSGGVPTWHSFTHKFTDKHRGTGQPELGCWERGSQSLGVGAQCCNIEHVLQVLNHLTIKGGSYFGHKMGPGGGEGWGPISTEISCECPLSCTPIIRSVYTHTHTHAHTHAHTCTHTYTHRHTHTQLKHTHTSTHTHRNTCTHTTQTHTHIQAHTHTQKNTCTHTHFANPPSQVRTMYLEPLCSACCFEFV